MDIVVKINIINNAVELYFKNNPNLDSVKPNELCQTILNTTTGINSGKQVRDVLRQLDDLNELYLIPSLKVDRSTVNRSWEFLNLNNKSSAIKSACKYQNSISLNTEQAKDEEYVLDLCDHVLKAKSLRQHRFDFLRGDAGHKLPVDAYYPELNIVVEYRERQHTESVPHFDKPNKMTVSGMNRSDQRKKYDQLRRDILPQHGITLIEISYLDFKYNNQKRIIRNRQSDFKIVNMIIDRFHLR